jgi:23S rRNA A2030 N6-methylase RlmJ
VGGKQAKQARALGQAREQGAVIALHPAVERALTSAFEANKRAKVTISLGYKLARGCLGTSRITASTRQNRAMIKSYVDIRHSFVLQPEHL